MTGSAVAGSRPLRAIVMLLFCWAGGRALYEFTPVTPATRPALQVAAHAITTDSRATRLAPPRQTDSSISDVVKPRAVIRAQGALALSRRSPDRSHVAHRTPESTASAPTSQPSFEDVAPHIDARVEVQSRPGARHGLTLSSWLLVRDGATGIAPAGTLGGAQIGARAYLPITQGIAATARVSAPLRSSGAEASAGFALRRGPVTLLLERRVALERGGRSDFSATIAAGIDGIRLPRQFRLDAYGQAGIVGRDGFVDGAVRVDRRIVRHGKSEIALGAGVWGGIQPGIARVDAGPQVIVRTPAAGGYLRASAEWRQRIAGNAQPASGPALTLGMDF